MTPTIDDVQQAAIAYYPSLEPGWLTNAVKARYVAWPRHVAITVARRITGKSLPQIGRKFKRDHTVVIHAMRGTAARVQSHPEIAAALEAITELACRRAELRATTARLVTNVPHGIDVGE